MGLIEKVSRLSLRVESDGFQQWRGICTQSWVSGVCVCFVSLPQRLTVRWQVCVSL